MKESTKTHHSQTRTSGGERCSAKNKKKDKLLAHLAIADMETYEFKTGLNNLRV